jgi:hypothetical protein
MYDVLTSYVKFSILSEEDSLQLTICECYSWEMALQVGLDVWFDWKGVWEDGGKVNSAKAYTRNDESSRSIFNGCYIIKLNSVALVCERTNVKIMESTNFWDMTPCSPLKVNRRFGGTCCLHLQGRIINRARNQRERRW